MRLHPNNFLAAGDAPYFRKGPARRKRGVALLVTLLLLALLSAASLAMVLSVSSDTMINGYYRNYRGSFYAADSGINVVVEAMKNSVVNSASPLAAYPNPPLPTGGVALPTNPSQWVQTTAGSFPAGLAPSYAPFQQGYYSMGDPGSWNGQFKLVSATLTNPPQFELAPNPLDSGSCLPEGVVTCPNGKTNDHDYVWTFAYPYSITVQGTAQGSESEQITETGVITYSSAPGSGGLGLNLDFSRWGAFITNFTDCLGPLVPGTMTGPFFTDGQWNFGNFSSPGYTFTDSVGQVGANVSWWSGSNCQDSPGAPNGFHQPNFQAGLNLNQNQIVPPTDTYNQAQAILDGKGLPPCTSTPCPADPPPSQTQENQELKTISGTAFPASGSAPTGVYIPYYTSGTNPQGGTCSSAHPCYGSSTSVSGGTGYAGGFYVNGNASITLTATTGGDGTSNPTQTYAITQGSTTTTIIVDNATSPATTTVKQGSTTLTLQGAPTQLDPNTGNVVTELDPSGNPVNPTLIYVNGQITGLTGPYDTHNNALPAIQNNTGVTVAATGNLSITGDLTYAQSPVSIPADTLVTTTNAGVLGLYTTGNINLYPDPSGNLTVDASMAAIGTGTSGFATPGGSINTWTIVGGRSEDQAHGVNISVGNTYYDRRFANNFGPPWFPTAVPQGGELPIQPTAPTMGVNRTSWQEKRASM